MKVELLFKNLKWLIFAMNSLISSNDSSVAVSNKNLRGWLGTRDSVILFYWHIASRESVAGPSDWIRISIAPKDIALIILVDNMTLFV